MKRLLLAALMLTAVTMLVPGLRERAAPRASAAWDWTKETVGPPLSPLLTPLRRMETESAMARIANGLIHDRNSGLPAPLGDELARFLRRKDLQESAVDAWGKPIRLIQVEDSIQIRSAGRDTIFDTDDDLLRHVLYPPRRQDFRGGRR